MLIAEGTGTDVPPPIAQEDVENKMQTSVELGIYEELQPLQQQVQPQIVVVPNTIQQVQPIPVQQVQIQQVQPAQTIQLQQVQPMPAQQVQQIQLPMIPMNCDINYYEPRQDTGSYQENMTPWLTDGQEYSFKCCFDLGCESKSDGQISDIDLEKGKIKNKKARIRGQTNEVYSVYHKANSNRLIVKYKVNRSALARAKNNPWFIYEAGAFFLGALLLGIGILMAEDILVTETDETQNILIGVGVGFIILAMFLFFFCKNEKMTEEREEIVTQSIPIESIFYVEREYHVQESKDGNRCCPNNYNPTFISDVTIGYNRSNLSQQLQYGASDEDVVIVKLLPNQAYNLHQYINCIIDGTHPQTSLTGLRDVSGGGSHLPRSASIHQAPKGKYKD